MQDERLTPGEMELEAALAGLTPARAASINRDRVMFLAGRASTRRRRYLWQGASVLLLVVLVASLVTRPKPEREPAQRDLIAAGRNQTVSVTVAAGATPDIDPAQVEAYRDYVRLRRWVLERGVDALPGSAVAPEGRSLTPTAGQTLRDFLSST